MACLKKSDIPWLKKKQKPKLGHRIASNEIENLFPGSQFLC